MAIGDKIDWRAGTIDPTTLQLIASAGAAQGAMYQSLGESVSKAFEKDSEDYIVDAGKAFDKADKLLEREDDEDFNKEKYEKLIKKGVNLFRKAGEKYNIISGGFYGDSTLRTEEDIYKFYGFDPSKPPRRVQVDLPSGAEGPEEKVISEARDTDWRSGTDLAYSEDDFLGLSRFPPLSKTPLGTGSTDPLRGMNTGEDWINPYSPSRATGPSRAAIADEIKAAYPDASLGGQVLPSPRNTLGIDQGLGVSLGYTPYHRSGGIPPLSKAPLGTGSTDPLSGMNIGEDWINPYPPSRAIGPLRLPDPQSAIDSVGRALDYNYPIPTNTGVESGRELPSIKQIANLAADAVIERSVPNLEAMQDISKRGAEAIASGGPQVWDYISGLPYPGTELSDDALAQMNQPEWMPDSVRTTPGNYPMPPNPINQREFVDIQNQQNPFNPSLTNEDSFLTNEASNALNDIIISNIEQPIVRDSFSPPLESLNVGGDDPWTYIDFLSPTEEDKETIKGYHQSNFR
mgnify:CR=1 FL=1